MDPLEKDLYNLAVIVDSVSELCESYTDDHNDAQRSNSTLSSVLLYS